MFTVATAIASHETARETMQEAYSQARSRLPEDAPIIGAIVFASSKFDQQEIVDVAAELLGKIPFIGASTAGEISNSGPSQAPSVNITLFASNTIQVVPACITEVGGSEFDKGAELANALAVGSDKDFELITIHCDGLKVDPSGVLRGMESALPNTPIAGGSAGDDGGYTQTFQYYNGKLLSNAAVAFGFSGALKVSIAVRHGWSPISSFRKVTKSEGAVVHEIDNQPAFEIYKEFLGEEEAEKIKEVTLAEIALSYPMGLVDPDSSEMLLRAPFYVDKTGSITFGGEVPEGSQVQLMMGSKEQAVEAAKLAGEEAMHELGTKPAAGIIFSCHVRDTLFASRDESKREIDAIQESIGTDTPLAGFYTYAEQAPIQGTSVDINTCDIRSHNETIVTILLAEKTHE